MSEEKKVREFLYIDIQKLYSFYSQIFDGLTEKITEEKIDELITGNNQGSFIQKATSTSKGVESSRYIETSILHDHMYNKLEEKLNINVLNDHPDQYNEWDSLAHGSIIKVSGHSEIEDYQYMNNLFENFNKIGESIAYCMNFPSIELETKEMKRQLETTKDKGRRRSIQEKIDALSNSNIIAKHLNLTQDQSLLEHLKFMSEMFNPLGYHIIIIPNNSNVHYRGIINRAWLREEPGLIRRLYSGKSKIKWNMIGTITNLPEEGSSDKTDDNNECIANKIESNENPPSMLDAYKKMFYAARNLDMAFIKSNTCLDVTVSPLAIYREFKIQIKN